jgi:hypothetical protein
MSVLVQVSEHVLALVQAPALGVTPVQASAPGQMVSPQAQAQQHHVGPQTLRHSP